MRYGIRCVSVLLASNFCSVICIGLSALIGAGCSAEHRATMRQGGFTHVVTPEPPPFLTGPAALLLTNRGSFSARLEVLSETSLGTERSSYGQLLGSGTKLLYAPESEENPDTHSQPGGYSFIWDTAQSRGYVLSEALQGYAPVAADLHVTNIQAAPGTAQAQRLSGHPCEAATITTQTGDGASATLDILQAMDLHNFPLRIQAQGKGPQFTVTISKLRFEPLTLQVFAPPDGFTQYPNPQAMADELAARQHNLRRKSGGAPLQALPELEPRRY
jgi:hypothetical protein